MFNKNNKILIGFSGYFNDDHIQKYIYTFSFYYDLIKKTNISKILK